MKSERRQVGGRYLARARGAFSRPDVRPRKPGGATGQPGAERRDTGHTGAAEAERISLAAMVAPARRDRTEN
jgi:hypothetical protein